MAPHTGYCTIAACNYLPQAVTLAHSLQRHHPGAHLTIVVADGRWPQGVEAVLPRGARLARPEDIGVPAQRAHDMRAIYDVLEFCTALKPYALAELRRSFDVVAYLDADTFVLGPMVELAEEATRHDLVVTPHFLRPITGGGSGPTEIHMLRVGIFNLGVIAVGPRSGAFVDWWAQRLEWDCLRHQSIGLFADQKWIDAAVALFDVGVFRHGGYNVGPWNVSERPVSWDGHGFTAGEHPLRLFHFSGFDPARPEALSVRLRRDVSDLVDEGLGRLANLYAEELRAVTAALGPLPPYAHRADSSGRTLTQVIRRTWRSDRLAGKAPPSPFDPADAAAFRSWRRKRFGTEAGLIAHDIALSIDNSWPDTVAWANRRFGGVTARARRFLLDKSTLRR